MANLHLFIQNSQQNGKYAFLAGWSNLLKMCPYSMRQGNKINSKRYVLVFAITVQLTKRLLRNACYLLARQLPRCWTRCRTKVVLELPGNSVPVALMYVWCTQTLNVLTVSSGSVTTLSLATHLSSPNVYDNQPANRQSRIFVSNVGRQRRPGDIA